MMTNSEIYDFLMILVSVCLGMFGRAVFDFIKNTMTKRRERKFIIEYLENAKTIFPILKKDYEKVQQVVPKRNLEVYNLGVFEGFNTTILSSISFTRFYELFKNNASFIYRIYGMVNAIQRDLPIPIYQKFSKSVGAIDKSLNQEDIDSLLIQQEKIALLTIDLKLKELVLLEKNIDEFLSKV